jgi:CubicO group peptidase (beta-lactamase class C family)
MAARREKSFNRAPSGAVWAAALATLLTTAALCASQPPDFASVAPGGVLMFDYSRPPGAASGGAGLVSTASDYLRFAQMLLNGGELEGVRILAPATVRLLASNHLADDMRAKPDEPFAARTGTGFGVDVAVVLAPRWFTALW